MMKETYERPTLGIELFEAVDVITESGTAPVGFDPESWELPFKP